jgi:hypothetical protein
MEMLVAEMLLGETLSVYARKGGRRLREKTLRQGRQLD